MEDSDATSYAKASFFQLVFAGCESKNPDESGETKSKNPDASFAPHTSFAGPTQRRSRVAGVGSGATRGACPALRDEHAPAIASRASKRSLRREAALTFMRIRLFLRGHVILSSSSS